MENEQKKKKTAQRLTRDALLLAMALAVYFLEAQLPPPVPIPGVKLGLSNIVIVYAMFRQGKRDAFAILVCRILLGSLFGGQAASLLLSASGGLFCFAAMLLVKKHVSEKQIPVVSITGAAAHNLGQLLAACLLMGRRELMAYLPLLMLSALATGLFTGLCAQELIRRLK